MKTKTPKYDDSWLPFSELFPTTSEATTTVARVGSRSARGFPPGIAVLNVPHARYTRTYANLFASHVAKGLRAVCQLSGNRRNRIFSQSGQMDAHTQMLLGYHLLLNRAGSSLGGISGGTVTTPLPPLGTTPGQNELATQINAVRRHTNRPAGKETNARFLGKSPHRIASPFRMPPGQPLTEPSRLFTHTHSSTC